MALATVFSDDLFFPSIFDFDRQLGRPSSGVPAQRGIAIDVVEKEKAIEVHADIPGVQKSDIKLNVEGDILTISVQKEEKKEEEKSNNGVKYHRSERSASYAKRALRFPETADLSSVKAKYENGTLCVEVPKVEKKEHSRQITIS
jgi:HSP20 family protein